MCEHTKLPFPCRECSQFAQNIELKIKPVQTLEGAYVRKERELRINHPEYFIGYDAKKEHSNG